MLPIVVLAGGLATRLGHITKETPKCLLEIKGRPFVDWQIELLRNAGYKDFVFCLSHKSDQIQMHLGDGSAFGVKIRYSLDGEKQLGTGGAIQKALPLLGPKFAVTYGDSYLPMDYSRVEEIFLNSQGPAVMTLYKNSGRFDSSNAFLNIDGFVTYSKNSPQPQMNYIDYGLMYFRSEAFQNTQSKTQIDLSDLCSDLSKVGKLYGFEVFNRFYEIGSLDGISDFTGFLNRELE